MRWKKTVDAIGGLELITDGRRFADQLQFGAEVFKNSASAAAVYVSVTQLFHQFK